MEHGEKHLAIVTGATSGVGFETARQLGREGWECIGIGRSVARCDEARRIVAAEGGAGLLRFEAADLSSQREVRELAHRLQPEIARANSMALVLNAAHVGSWYETTEDGLEKQFAVNHLTGFLLTHEIIASLLTRELREPGMAWPEVRIVTLSSGSHRHGRMHWADVNLRSRYGALRAYAQSKLANVLFTMRLRRVLDSLPTVAAVAADPGLVDTGLGQKATSGMARAIWKLRRGSGRAAAEAAASIVSLIALPVDELRAAPYWYDAAPLEPARRAYSSADATLLWELSNRLCGTGEGWVLAAGR